MGYESLPVEEVIKRLKFWKDYPHAGLPSYIEQAIAKLEQCQIGFCKWHLEEKDGYNLEEHDYWETSCDNLFQFNAGGPENNRFKFCPYCGKPIEEVEE